MAEPRVQLRAAGLRDGGEEHPREVSTCWVGCLIQRTLEQTCARESRAWLSWGTAAGTGTPWPWAVCEELQHRAEDNPGGFGQGGTACTSCDLLSQTLLKHHLLLPWLTPTFPVKSNGKGSPKTDFTPWQITRDKERIRFGHLLSGLTSSEKPRLALVVQWPMCHGIHQGSSPKPVTQTTKRQWRHKNYKFGPLRSRHHITKSRY